MTERLARLLENQKLVLTLVVVFALAGLAAFLTMDRQEDPSFPYRAGRIVTLFAGADPERVERLVLEPLEEQLAQVEEIDFIESVARQGVAVTTVRLEDNIYDTAAAWDRVRVAMDKAIADFPEGVTRPTMNDRIIGASTIVYAITGDPDPIVLANAAEKLKKRLLSVPSMSDITIFGDPGEQVTVAIEDSVIARTGLSPQGLVSNLQSSNQIISGGSVRLAGASVNLKPATDYRSIDEIRETPITLASGQTVPLGSIARVFHSSAQPPTQRMWFNGERAVGLELRVQRDVSNVVAFGERVRQKMDSLRAEFAPLEVHEMFYQPAKTEERLSNLINSLFYSVLIIIAVLFFTMGLRMGLIVAALLPLVTLSALAIYAFGDGVLHQMAVIAMVVSLGILVDNAIVMTENVQYHLNRGESPDYSAVQSVRELAGPLFAATGTTLAAFVPLLLSEGGTADFTRAIPVMIMLALSISYIFAVTFTPILSKHFLRPQKRPQIGDTAEHGRLARFSDSLAVFTTRYAKSMLALGLLAILASFFCMRFLDQEFFPNADRNQVVIDLTLAEGTHLDTTTAAARKLEQAIRTRPGVGYVHAFIGTGGPAFYYNLSQRPQSPQRARLVVGTDSLARNHELIAWVDEFGSRELPQADLVGGILRQGPPITAPIEVRVYNADPERLATATERIFEVVLNTPGSRDARHDLGTGVPSVNYEINDAVAGSFGVTRVDVAQALLGRSHGLVIGQYRAGDDPIPIKLRSPQGERFDLAALETANIYAADGSHVPLVQVAKPVLEMQPGAIHHRDQRRLARIYSELDSGVVYSEVLGPMRKHIAELELPQGTEVAFGGEAEESAKANTAIFQTAPLGIAILLFFLLFEFNSFKRVGLVLLTLPFAMVGVIPGLLLLGYPFGFQPLLGMIALVGIVVNNAIVLIDVIDHRLAEGHDILDAVQEAVRRRTRPILLTTATTIAGLLPLALSETTLWPPMAWAIITGLLASTVLTLLVLPAVCKLTLNAKKRTRPAQAAPAILLVAAMVASLTYGSPADAQATAAQEIPEVTFNAAALAGSKRPRVAADGYRALAAREAAKAEFRTGVFPSLQARASAARRDEVGEFEVPGLNGGTRSFQVGDRNTRGATIELRQPLIDPAQQFYTAPSAKQRARSAESTYASNKLAGAVEASEAYLDALTLKARLDVTRDLLDSLTARDERISKLVEAGRALKSDHLEVNFARQQAIQSRAQLEETYRVAQASLARAVGQDGRLIPAPLDYEPPPVETDVDVLLKRALPERQDLQAMDQQIEAAELSADAVNASRWPSLDAVASLQYNEGNSFAPDREGRIAAQLTWRPFAGGVISARRGEALAEVSALRAQRLEFVRDIRLQLEQSVANLITARTLRELAVTGIESAQATLDTRSARFETGRANVDDVLDADAELSRQRSMQLIARYDELRAWVRIQGALAQSGWVRKLPQ